MFGYNDFNSVTIVRKFQYMYNACTLNVLPFCINLPFLFYPSKLHRWLSGNMNVAIFQCVLGPRVLRTSQCNLLSHSIATVIKGYNKITKNVVNDTVSHHKWLVRLMPCKRMQIQLHTTFCNMLTCYY